QLPVNQETLDILVANIIPTSKYFEARFDHLENRVERIQSDLISFRSDIDKNISGLESSIGRDINGLRGDVDKRFEQVDKRFEQVDKRFEQMILSIDKLTDKLENRDELQRHFTLRMFTISITISILGATGAFLKALSVF
ncbi:MAG: hypothetical protein DSY80_02445, partial [Desulfocapsa sp.]